MMKRTIIALTAIVSACALAYSQEEVPEENINYEKLKVLEPLIGTWEVSATNDESGVKWGGRIIASWSDSQRTFLVEFHTRSVDGDGDLATEEWRLSQRVFYVWNDAEGRIEFFIVNVRRGTVAISEAQVKRNDAGIVIKYPRIRLTGKEGFTSDRMDTVTKGAVTVKFYNRKGEAGENPDDMEFTFQKVK